MKVYAFIPAKKKSVRLKNKNFLKISNKPLWEIVATNCLLSNCFDKIIVSTDKKNLRLKFIDNKIVLDNRPKYLSKKNSTVADVSNYLIQKYNIKKNDIFCVIYPTAILINHKIIKKSFLKFKKENLKFLMSVQKFRTSPIKALKKKGKFLEPIIKKSILKQTDKNFYFSNGGFYWYQVSYFFKYINFYPKEISGFLLSNNQNVDLDDLEDLKSLKNIIKSNNIKF